MDYYLRFVTYLAAVLISLFLVWFGLKSYAEKQPLSNYQTNLVSTLKEHHPTPQTWLHINSMTKNHKFQWFEATFRDDKWVLSDAPTKTLASQLSSSTSQYQLLHIDLNSPQALPELRELLNQNEYWKKTIICSQADGILQDLRALEPEWSFCSGEVLMTRMLGLSSIRLGALISIKPDVFFIHLKNISLSKNLLDAMREAKRQNKLIFAGPVSEAPSGYPVDAWMVKK